MRKLLQLSALLGLAACSTAPAVTAPPVVPPPPTSVSNAAEVGKGSKPGFCVYQDASGKMIEAKCK